MKLIKGHSTAQIFACATVLSAAVLQIHQRVKIDHANLLHLLETKQKS